MTNPAFSHVLYLDDAASDVSGYKKLPLPPFVPGAEATLTGVGAVGAGDVLIKAFASDVLGLVSWPAGDWTFNLFASVDNTDDTTQIKVKVYQRDSTGTETLLLTATSAAIKSLTAFDISFTANLATPTTTAVTDRLVIKLYHLTNSASSRTTTLYYEGVVNQSRILTPFGIPISDGDMFKKIYDPSGIGAAGGSGSGDVSRYGAQTPGNLAIWTDDTHISDGGAIPSIANLVIGAASVTDGHLSAFDGDGYHIKDSGILPTQGTLRSGSTADGHLAVWNGADAESIKDGGAVPTGTVITNGAITDGHLSVFDTDTSHIKDGGAVPTAGVTRSGSTVDDHLAVWDGADANSIKDGGDIPAAGGDVISSSPTAESMNVALFYVDGYHLIDMGIPSGSLVLGDAAATDGHVALFDGDGYLLKDGGPVPTGDTLSGATTADHAIVRYNGTDNKTIQDSLATIDDSGGINIPSGQTYNIDSAPHTHAAVLPVFHGCYVGSGEVILPNEVDTEIDFISEIFDTDVYHDNSTNPDMITIPIGLAGKYLITVQVETDFPANDGYIAAMVYLNIGDVTVLRSLNYLFTASGTIEFSFVKIISLAEADYIGVNLYQSTGDDLTIVDVQMTIGFMGA